VPADDFAVLTLDAAVLLSPGNHSHWLHEALQEYDVLKLLRFATTKMSTAVISI